VCLFVCRFLCGYGFLSSEKCRGVKFCMHVGLLSGQVFSPLVNFGSQGVMAAAAILPGSAANCQYLAGVNDPGCSCWRDSVGIRNSIGCHGSVGQSEFGGGCIA